MRQKNKKNSPCQNIKISLASAHVQKSIEGNTNLESQPGNSTKSIETLTKREILTEISNRLPEDFDALEDPKHKLHFLAKATNEVMEEFCGLEGQFILVDGSMTLLELLEDQKKD